MRREVWRKMGQTTCPSPTRNVCRREWSKPTVEPKPAWAPCASSNVPGVKYQVVGMKSLVWPGAFVASQPGATPRHDAQAMAALACAEGGIFGAV